MKYAQQSIMKIALLLVITLTALTGCSTFTSNNFTLLTTTSDQHVRVAQQQWVVQQGEKNYTLEVISERSANHWRWIMLNPLGQRVATVAADHGHVQIEQHQSHPLIAVLPELLQAWQFSYWPLADLQTTDLHWRFVERDGRREAHFSGILRASIDYQQLTDRANPWLGTIGYNAGAFSLLIHSQPLN